LVDTPVRTTSGTYTEYIVANSGNNVLNLRADDGAFVGSIDNVSVIEITDDTDLPRINYTNGEGSLLLEPQSTNLITYSEDYTDVNTWIKGQVTLDSNNIISPDGTKNASKLTISGGTPYLGNTKILTANNTYTVSCFVKKGTNRWVRLTNITSGTTGAWFDLENKVVGSRSPSSLSSSIKSYGNDWYKIQNTFIAQYGSANTFLGLSDSDNQTSSTQIGNTVYVWGFQIEELSYATSYIPTNGSTVTRLADVCNNAGSSDLINSTEGVLYAEISALSDDQTNRAITLSDGTNNNVVQIFYATGSSNKIRFQIRVNGVGGDNLDFTTTNYTIKNYNKIAIKYKLNDAQVWINGTKIHTDLNSGVPNSLSQIDFNYANTGLDFYGNVKCVAVFKEALDNDQLERLTGEGYETFNLLAQANNYTII
jgi:hypothetical protein